MFPFFTAMARRAIFVVFLVGALPPVAIGQTDMQELHQQISKAREELMDSQKAFNEAARSVKKANLEFEISDNVATPVRYEKAKIRIAPPQSRPDR